jgi:molybdopterin molybdotransferase
VLIQPGRPMVFGKINEKYFFGLPGNPVSTLTTFDLFVRPMIDALAGARAKPLHFLQARLKSEIKTKTGLTRFLPGVLSDSTSGCGEGGGTPSEVELIKWAGSGDLGAAARANCYVVIPSDRERIAAGEMIAVLPHR